MGDIYCRICGEPFDAYGVYHGDLTPTEKTKFLKGLGCPCCKGEKPQPSPDHTNEFLESLTNPSNTDLDPLELLDNVEL